MRELKNKFSDGYICIPLLVPFLFFVIFVEIITPAFGLRGDPFLLGALLVSF